MFSRKNSDLKAIEKTIKILAGYHAVKVSEPRFLKQYNHLIQLYITLCNKTGHKSCLEI